MTNFSLYRFYQLLLLLFLPFATIAQQKKEIVRSLFYNIPVGLPGQKLVEQLVNHPSFKKLIDQNASSSGFGYNYKGNILLKDFPSTMERPEEAIIKLSGSLGYMVDTQKDYETSDLTVEYLFTGEESADAYFSYVWDQIKTLSKDTSDAQFGLRDEEDFAFGKSVKLAKRKMLPEIYLLKREHGGKMYVSIIYRREGY